MNLTTKEKELWNNSKRRKLKRKEEKIAKEQQKILNDARKVIDSSEVSDESDKENQPVRPVNIVETRKRSSSLNYSELNSVGFKNKRLI